MGLFGFDVFVDLANLCGSLCTPMPSNFPALSTLCRCSTTQHASYCMPASPNVPKRLVGGKWGGGARARTPLPPPPPPSSDPAPPSP